MLHAIENGRRPPSGRMMRRAIRRLLLAAGLVLIGTAAAAQEALPPGLTQAEPPAADVEAAIQETIVGQIEAFQADDGARALTFAVPQARNVWPTPEAFMGMVREGYAAIYRPDEFTFEGAVAQGDVARQLVRFRDQTGRIYLALYDMFRQSDGRWLIGAVRTVEVDAGGDPI